MTESADRMGSSIVPSHCRSLALAHPAQLGAHNRAHAHGLECGVTWPRLSRKRGAFIWLASRAPKTFFREIGYTDFGCSCRGVVRLNSLACAGRSLDLWWALACGYRRMFVFDGSDTAIFR